MDNKQILNQMIQFNKTAFDNSFSAMKMAQEQSETMVKSMIEQAEWLPEEGKKLITDWIGAYKKGCDDLKAAMDENYKKVEKFLAGS